MDACCDRGSTFRLKCFLNDLRHSLNQNRRNLAKRFAWLLFLYLGHGSFHPVSALFFLKSVLGRGLKAPKLKTIRKKKVVHLYRSMRPYAY